MASNRIVARSAVSVAETQLARVAADGCARHAYLAALIDSATADFGRDMADAVHLLCNLHGRPPALVELAASMAPAGPARDWLANAADAFERERLFLVRLTSAVGPVPSTPGAAETEATLLAQRHAMETLARSERSGCALGAATALIADWWPVRRMLDCAASRAGINCPPPALPDEASIIRAIETCCDTSSSERALGFGVEQLLLQHRGLFDLLEARAEARNRF